MLYNIGSISIHCETTDILRFAYNKCLLVCIPTEKELVTVLADDFPTTHSQLLLVSYFLVLEIHVQHETHCSKMNLWPFLLNIVT
jgi:hypothetical protein